MNRPTEDTALRNLGNRGWLTHTLCNDPLTPEDWQLANKELDYIQSGASPKEAMTAVARDLGLMIGHVTARLRLIEFHLLLRE